MCSVFKSLDMDNFQGDLTDVVRGLGSGHVSSSPGPPEGPSPTTLSPPPPPQSTTSDLLLDFSSVVADTQAQFLPKEGIDNFRTGTTDNHQIIKPFGDPFVTITDPLLQELNLAANSGYFSVAGDNNNSENNNSNNNNGFRIIPKVFEEDRIKSQCSIFPRIRISQSNMIQDVATCNSPVIAAHGTSSAGVASPWGIINVVENTNSPRNCVLIDNNNNNTSSSSQIQISSSPRNLGIKRRKSQAKKVVCIPAPAAMNSRSSGEVVPSDLWAWRKYGQKPIKGSPYPRGYYRCSSSKGCSARKQVERSRNDPNMLVITYTSEHNHPWPTQRNALAGSTRSSNPNNSSKPLTASTVSTASNAQNNNKEVDEPNKTHLPNAVKEEEGIENMEFDLEDHEQNIQDKDDEQLPPYRPESSFNHNQEDFFADLDELEGDSLTMLLTQGFTGGTSNDLEDKTTTLPDVFSDFFDDDTSSKSL